MVIVQHIADNGQSDLPALLQRRTALSVRGIEDGQPLLRGQIVVAPSGRHVILKRRRIALRFGPRINGSRPAIDTLFYGAARSFGKRTIGVLLSGFLDDGVAGLLAIQRAGGITIVQQPGDAEVDEMPRSALKYLSPDYLLAASAMGPLLNDLAKDESENVGAPAMTEEPFTEPEDKSEEFFGYSCPDCGGPMRPAKDIMPPTYECHVGHVRTAESLFHAQTSVLERSI